MKTRLTSSGSLCAVVALVCTGVASQLACGSNDSTGMSGSGSGSSSGGGGSGGGSSGGGSSGGSSGGSTSSGGGSSGGGSGGSSGGTSGGSSGGGMNGGDAGQDAATFTLPSGTPATVLLDGAQLAALQQQLGGGSGGSAEQKAALANLVAAADMALTAGTWTVTTKDAMFVANSDPHAYVSWGPYWWPPDATPPGTPGTTSMCPYVQHDGIRNPNVDKITDRHGLHATTEAIFELALAWYLTGNPAYADQAELLARTWFLDPATKMNPDMAYGQTHGPCGVGNAAGLIEASGGYMTDALDGLAILALDTRAKGWTADDQTGIQTWMKSFLGWVQTSTIGMGENAALNNHGTWYDAFVSSLLLFTGDMAGAKTLVTAAEAKRIDSQIMADGSMPQELSRTTSWHYSNYNAAAMCRLALTAKHVGVDLWGYTSGTGGSIVKAIDFLLPTATAASLPGPWAMYNDITMPFDAVYVAESYYTIRAAAQYGSDSKAQAVVSMTPVPVQVPGHFCSGERFPTGSDFCAMTPGTMAFADLQPSGTPAVDMWSIIPTCRVPVN